MSARILGALEEGVFAHRRLILWLFAAITLALAYPASQLRMDAGFQKHLPLSHPYIQTYLKYQQEFGGANRLLVAVRAKEGTIFTPEFFDLLARVTDEVFFLPGVDRSTVRSIFTPNVRFIETVEGGLAGGNVVPADFRPTPKHIDQVRENILKAGIVGRLVANDFTTAMVSAELVEIDPATGRSLDYLQVAHLLEEKIRGKYADEHVDIHILGFAKLIGDIVDGAFGVILFFGVAFVIITALVYLFTHLAKLTVLPLLCSIIAVLWMLGLLTLLDRGLDPLWILVPFLIFAIGVSHGVQMINAIGAELSNDADSLAAARTAFRRLLIPGSVALASDTIGFLTLLLIDIGIIQELAITATLGIMVIIFTNLFLLPILTSYLQFGDRYRQRLARSAKRKAQWWRALARVMEPRIAATVIAAASILLVFGLIEARHVKIGDLQAGVPELRPDSRFNRDVAVMSDKFSGGADRLTIMVETVPNGCIEHDVMTTIDRFQWHVANVPGVRLTFSMPQVAKRVHALWNDGNLKWRELPRNSQAMVEVTSSIAPSTGLLNRDCSVMPVFIFLEDHKADTIERVIDAIKTFARQNGSARHTFRLAAGNVGIMAATNRVVEDAQGRILLWIYVAIVLLCLVSLRSWRLTLCIVAPLGLISVLSYTLMSLLEIGLKISTLPVAALGVGIGVDYAIYMSSRFKSLLDEGLGLQEAFFQTLCVTGNAVLVTGLTLAAGISTWIFSALKFQADMGLLLTFKLLANMLGALLLLPALAFVVYSFRNRTNRCGN